MRREDLLLLCAALILSLCACGGGGSSNNNGGGNNGGGGNNPPPPPTASNTPFWAQWGANAQHSGAVSVVGQAAARQLADIVYDPFVAKAQAESGDDLLTHYQAPIVDGDDVYMTVKTGTYTSCNPVGSWTNGAACGPNAWNSQIWNAARYTWINNTLTKVWLYASDWKPVPNGASIGAWEPVFHPVDANNFLYVPGAGGTVWKLNKTDGTSSGHINPFTSMQPEWQFQSTNTQSCSRNSDGTLSCVSDHPDGFEWCINMPAVDSNGTVYANSEDGNLCVIPQGNTGVFSTPQSKLFLNLALGAAYTPLSIGPDGRLYTQNDGHLFVVGN